MPQPNDPGFRQGQALSRSLVALDQNSTIIAVIEMSHSSWLVAGILPRIERQPRKKLELSPERLLGLLHRCQHEAVRAGRTITRIALAFEAGHDGFWLARWLAASNAARAIVAVGRSCADSPFRRPTVFASPSRAAPCPARREFSKNGRVLSLGSRGPRSRLVPPPCTEFASDSPVEESGFEPLVPL
jgi:hypothetical protein